MPRPGPVPPRRSCRSPRSSSRACVPFRDARASPSRETVSAVERARRGARSRHTGPPCRPAAAPGARRSAHRETSSPIARPQSPARRRQPPSGSPRPSLARQPIPPSAPRARSRGRWPGPEPPPGAPPRPHRSACGPQPLWRRASARAPGAARWLRGRRSIRQSVKLCADLDRGGRENRDPLLEHGQGHRACSPEARAVGPGDRSDHPAHAPRSLGIRSLQSGQRLDRRFDRGDSCPCCERVTDADFFERLEQPAELRRS